MSLKTLNKLLFVGVIMVWIFVFYIKSYNTDYPKIAQVISSVLPASFVVEKPSDSPEWSLLLTGDVIPARSVNAQMTARNDFGWALTNISQILKNADLTVINLEAPLLTNCPVTNEGMRFCGDARFTKSLVDAGVDIANLANNHSLNHGWEGLAETEKHLSDAGIETTGFSAFNTGPAAGVLPKSTTREPLFGSPSARVTRTDESCSQSLYCSRFVIKEVPVLYSSSPDKIGMNSTRSSPLGNSREKLSLRSNNIIKVGFLGYNAVGQTIDRELVKQQIETADKLVDVLAVSVHWGKEYERIAQLDISLAPDDPKELGKLFIEWGADVVAGNHPHVVQGIEWVTDKPIFYALGNTVFDQEWSAETKVGYLAKIHFSGNQVIREQLEIIPIGIRNYGQAYILEGNDKEKVLQALGSQ